MNWPAAFGFPMILGAGVFGWMAGWSGGWKRPCNRIRPTELVAGRARVCRIGGCKGGSGRVAGGT